MTLLHFSGLACGPVLWAPFRIGYARVFLGQYCYAIPTNIDRSPKNDEYMATESHKAVSYQNVRVFSITTWCPALSVTLETTIATHTSCPPGGHSLVQSSTMRMHEPRKHKRNRLEEFIRTLRKRDKYTGKYVFIGEISSTK